MSKVQIEELKNRIERTTRQGIAGCFGTRQVNM